MTLTKYQLFNDFFKQNKQAKLFIGIDYSIINFGNFLQFFKDNDYLLVIYENSQQLEKEIKSFEDIIIIVLTSTNLQIQCIDNDKRLFVFQTQEKRFNIDFSCKVEEIAINTFIHPYFLSNCFINYISLNKNLYVSISTISGFGLFTRTMIKKDAKLFTLTGEVVNKKFLKTKNFNGEWNALSANKFLIRHHRTSYGFINHSRNPNCKIDTDTMTIVVIKDIRENEEILLDYREEPLPEDYVNGFGKTYL
ncbi:MAG: SET domain-containing protein [Candidatus Gracilibacteria bacterium]